MLEVIMIPLVKTLIKPWKGLKLCCGCGDNRSFRRVKTLIKPWKGLKQTYPTSQIHGFEPCENPNKTLEGIKTMERDGKRLRVEGENPNKTLEGIKTREQCFAGRQRTP
ncbi:hypothetical protein U27_01425 [Candidatus Vecturithrix granuli]|uniref:Uncharacterized protein n=1 Tax=Vecturithrix granuli TaxID=1499967 RepID=A0A081CAB9_VECG1|nr:hypothetical protein U27_01425 [Candidatus Vecturithrix granuli]